ncbi:hypothetical protein RW03080701_137 [Synechococcus phage S-RIM8]|uniref:Uncharacterized protein n=2 Tax=Neptunevirus srim18 TaxID=2734121 RepID=A0A1D7SC19_9CAUD|nr:hypothetical protein SXDG_00211 [Synechococcus phage S-RIM8 A.HR1]YP_009783049.1 hypothetical protein HOQ82_gp105 [Synechococcus phage S-RIM8]AFB15410.1 hypothetical protein SWSG_00154 [Synechococcus phage S-RIM8 A.HR5]AFB17839.1 hypothetical protein SXEG_00045 [Synechococcus phage S-RIM8 A.HR3]AGH57908.1 hypothetical protein CPJG_00156 [Synechococcus phage KBS-M-1A]AFB17627.1 hypothetical protein SXDG_00211 [Synechococcus phage S-RIM8 A.HR1]AOO10287.1 hypothetical protein RW01021201_139 [
MNKTERLVPKQNYTWALIKKDFDRCHHLVLKLAEKNGGMESLNELVNDDRRVQKFCGIRSVFNENCLEMSDSEEYAVSSTAFDKGFSRYLQSNTKIAGKFYPTFRKWKKHYAKWKKEKDQQNFSVQEEPEVNDNFSGIEAIFAEAAKTPSVADEILSIKELGKQGAKSVKSPSGWEVTF